MAAATAITANELVIANSALDRLGVHVITETQRGTPDNKASRLIVRDFGLQRNALLRDHPWNFSIIRLELSSPGTPVYGYNYDYTLPSGWLRVLGINDEILWSWTWGSWYKDSGYDKFKIENGKILSDIGVTIDIQYISEVTTVATMEALFIETLAVKCAHAWCETLTSSNSVKDRLAGEYKMLLQESRSVDGQEGIPDALQTTEWLRVRV